MPATRAAFMLVLVVAIGSESGCSASRASSPGAGPDTHGDRTSAGATAGPRAAAGDTPAKAHTLAGSAEGDPTRAADRALPDLRILVDRTDDALALRVENHSAETVSLRATWALEREIAPGTWSAVDLGLPLDARADCRATPPRCIDLAPGAELAPPPLRTSPSRPGDRCICDTCRPVPPGPYRLTVPPCSGPGSWRGQAMHL